MQDGREPYESETNEAVGVPREEGCPGQSEKGQTRSAKGTIRTYRYDSATRGLESAEADKAIEEAKGEREPSSDSHESSDNTARWTMSLQCSR